MKQRIRIYALGIYDLVLSCGAIYYGIEMVRSSRGIFTEYPKEWLTKVPFTSWVVPGIIAIVVFGLGNIFAAIVSFTKIRSKPWPVSAIMGALFFMSLVAQVIILREWYMATQQFFLFSIIQLYMSGSVFWGFRKNQIESKKAV